VPETASTFQNAIGCRRNRDLFVELTQSILPRNCSGLRAQDFLIAANLLPRTEAHRSIRVLRLSSNNAKTRERAGKHKDTYIRWSSGQSAAGLCSMDKLCKMILQERLQGCLNLEIAGSSDRLLRQGVLLAETLLKQIGVSIETEGGVDECMHKEGMFVRRTKDHKALGNWHIFLSSWINSQRGELVDSVLPLMGISESWACGAGAEFIHLKELVNEIYPQRLYRLRDNSSYRTFGDRRGGYWLVERGTRQRFKLASSYTPIVVEDADLDLMKKLHPHATFGSPVLLSGSTKTRLKKLQSQLSSPKNFLAVDHASLRLGTSLDLDALMRVNRSTLLTCLPSSPNWPDLNKYVGLA